MLYLRIPADRRGFIQAIIPAPATSYAYTVGGGGAAGTQASGQHASAGGTGRIIVKEFYQ